MSIGDYENATSRAWESIIRKIEDERDALQARLDAALDVIEAARLLTRRDTFDMRIVKVREDNLLDALAVFDGLAPLRGHMSNVWCFLFMHRWRRVFLDEWTGTPNEVICGRCGARPKPVKRFPAARSGTPE